MKTWILIGVGVLAVLAGAFLVVNKVAPVSWGLWGSYNTAGGLALKGYDPVAYFTEGRPVPGGSRHSIDWGGVTWQFSSAENKDLFSGDPESYAPQFGGFCSFAVSKGFTADASPDAWHIEDGKLYLFDSEGVRDTWVETIASGSLEKSTANWSKR